MKTKRAGLTLPEVLVTLAIIAVVAAVLVPALTSQLTKGDAGRVSEDLKAVQTGIQAFVSDVRRYPKTINQLSNAITTVQGDLVTTASYTARHVSRWRGPYFVRDIEPADTDFETGYGGKVLTTLLSTTVTGTGGTYLGIEVSGLSPTERDQVDVVLDDGVSSSGLFRIIGNDTLYLAVVVQ
ncbi:MAG TPA: prepilin-type N-terminal cleavage/methylation domain-containing protein [Gemmatimonadaceae bacterium]|nr:prepilin-type N-terminal cleavage/methylation domain-containing protein [Gemmatimonadaceae bacterium]